VLALSLGFTLSFYHLLVVISRVALSQASVSGLCDKTFGWIICQSVRLSVGLSICPPGVLWQNGRMNPDAV